MQRTLEVPVSTKPFLRRHESSSDAFVPVWLCHKIWFASEVRGKEQELHGTA